MAFDCLRKLHKEELYTNVVHLGNLLMTVVERKSNFLTAYQQYQTAVYYADGLFQVGQFKKAGQTYMKALTFLKNRLFVAPSAPPPTPSGKSRSSASAAASQQNQNEMTPENEVKFRLHLCLVKQNKLKEAIGVLDSIPSNSKTPKVNSALGELHRKLNLLQQAKQCYKDLLTAAPYAIDAAVELLLLGVPMDELLQIVGVIEIDQWATTFQADEWFESWLVGHFTLARRDYMAAASIFRDLDTKTMLANNPRLLCQLAKSYYNAGEYSKAITVFQRVHSLDPLFLNGMDILASLLAEEKSRTKELESLATQLMSSNPESAVAWVAMGYLCKSMKKYPKALYFAHKACGDAQAAYIEAMLLKGVVLLESKKFTEGALHFHEALLANPHRFELYEGLVSCHLEQHKMKEARMAAGFCLKQVGQNARTITLYASVLSRDQATIGEAQTILEKAVAAAPYLLKAVYLLVEIYDKQGNYNRAVDLLRRQTSTHVKHRLHRLLGDFLSKADRPTEAMDSYRFALCLEPGDSHAEAGLVELGDRLRVDTLCPDLESSLLPSTSGANTKTTTEISTATAGQESGTMTESTTGARGNLQTPETSGTNAVTPAGQPSTSYGSHLTNAPGRRGAASTSMATTGNSSLAPPPRLVVSSLDASAMTPLTDNDVDATTPADTAAVDDFGEEDMLSGGDDSGPFGDGGSDVY